MPAGEGEGAREGEGEGADRANSAGVLGVRASARRLSKDGNQDESKTAARSRLPMNRETLVQSHLVVRSWSREVGGAWVGG